MFSLSRQVDAHNVYFFFFFFFTENIISFIYTLQTPNTTVILSGTLRVNQTPKNHPSSTAEPKNKLKIARGHDFHSQRVQRANKEDSLLHKIAPCFVSSHFELSKLHLYSEFS